MEPVSAGDSIAGPVMKVFVGNYAFDAQIGGIRRCVWRSENATRVEDIESLIFHGSHVEIFNRNDHEGIEIVFSAEGDFIPRHRAFE